MLLGPQAHRVPERAGKINEEGGPLFATAVCVLVKWTQKGDKIGCAVRLTQNSGAPRA